MATQNTAQSNTTGSGWVKLHRSIFNWEWYDDHNTTRLFIHLLLKAQHSPSKYRGVEVPKGSLKTGRLQLADETGLSQQQIRTSLRKLESTNEITIKPSNKYSIIAMNNWDSYQSSNQQDNQQVTNNQPTDNQQVTTCKNDKNANKVNNKDLIAFAQGLVADPVRRELITEWLEYKVEIKKPMKAERGIKSMVTQWEPYTNEQMREVINLSMANNYSGIVFDKIKANKQPSVEELFND